MLTRIDNCRVQAHQDLEYLRQQRLAKLTNFEPVDGYSTFQLAMFHKLFEAYGRKRKKRTVAVLHPV